MIKLIACDMDGTLLRDDRKISPENIEAVHRLRERGIYFVIATGRHDSMIKVYLDELGIEMPVISCNGALVREPFGDKLYYSVPIDKKQVLTIIDICHDQNIQYTIYSRDKIYVETLNYRMKYYQERNHNLPEREQVPLLIDPDYKKFVDDHEDCLLKVMIIVDDQQKSKTIGNEILRQTGLNIHQSANDLYDIMEEGITKSHAIEALSKELGIKKNEIAAIGDQVNDLEMIKYAGVGVAMANAVDDVKESAQYITKNNNNNSGVAEAITKILDM